MPAVFSGYMISSFQNGCGSGGSVASTNVSKIKLVIFLLPRCFDLTVTRLPFLKLKCCFEHVSFPQSLSERRIVVFPKSELLLDKVKDLIAPCVIRIKSSVVFR